MKEQPNHKLRAKAVAEKPRNFLVMEKNLAKQLIIGENSKHPSCEPDTNANEHWPVILPAKRTCKNCFTKKNPSTFGVKCVGCSRGQGQANLCIKTVSRIGKKRNKK